MVLWSVHTHSDIIGSGLILGGGLVALCDQRFEYDSESDFDDSIDGDEDEDDENMEWFCSAFSVDYSNILSLLLPVK
jgi:hypothetical protein